MSAGTAPGAAPARRPSKPPPSMFAISMGVLAVVMTGVTVVATEFSLTGFIEDVTRPNSSFRGLVNINLGQITNPRTLVAFVETLQIAVVGTIIGGFLALPLALWNSPVGAPNQPVYLVTKAFNNVIRAIPDVLWALLFVSMVGIGVLPGILALVFFSIAVTCKLTSDVLDGVDPGPAEAANASGASHTKMLRTAIVPQILPSYSSFLLYNFEINLRASAVLGLVGAGGVGRPINLYRNLGQWDDVWGIIALFFIITVVVERFSLMFRRRLV